MRRGSGSSTTTAGTALRVSTATTVDCGTAAGGTSWGAPSADCRSSADRSKLDYGEFLNCLLRVSTLSPVTAI
jgi:hypothetical protein